MSARLGVALIGAGWISRQYAGSLQRLPDARVVGVASRSRKSATTLAAELDAPIVADFDNLDDLFDDARVDVVCVNSPNHLHAAHALAALRAGKHVIVEKPLCLTLGDADAVIAASREAGRSVAYAENLVFAPLFRQARELIRAGRIGTVRWARHCEKHGGPYSPWFFSAHEAGGGALADMGCHGIECLRWLLDKPRIARVSARLDRLRHRERTALEDDAVVTLELEDQTVLVSESSWAVPSGMQSTLEVHGSEGTLRADLLGQTGLELFRPEQGWSRPSVDFLRDSGYVGELEHFLDCFRSGAALEESAEDGRAVLEILMAAYASAARRAPVALPFDPGDVLRPVELWIDPNRRTGPR